MKSVPNITKHFLELCSSWRQILHKTGLKVRQKKGPSSAVVNVSRFINSKAIHQWYLASRSHWNQFCGPVQTVVVLRATIYSFFKRGWCWRQLMRSRKISMALIAVAKRTVMWRFYQKVIIVESLVQFMPVFNVYGDVYRETGFKFALHLEQFIGV